MWYENGHTSHDILQLGTVVEISKKNFHGLASCKCSLTTSSLLRMRLDPRRQPPRFRRTDFVFQGQTTPSEPQTALGNDPLQQRRRGIYLGAVSKGANKKHQRVSNTATAHKATAVGNQHCNSISPWSCSFVLLRNEHTEMAKKDIVPQL